MGDKDDASFVSKPLKVARSERFLKYLSSFTPLAVLSDIGVIGLSFSFGERDFCRGDLTLARAEGGLINSFDFRGPMFSVWKLAPSLVSFSTTSSVTDCKESTSGTTLVAALVNR